jgi:hypothetical protein
VYARFYAYEGTIPVMGSFKRYVKRTWKRTFVLQRKKEAGASIP